MNARPVASHRTVHHGRSFAAILLSITAILVAACTPTVTTVPGSAFAATVPPAGTDAPAASAPPAASDPPAASGQITLYSTVTQATVEAVVAGYQAAHPGVVVDVFRAPTGEVSARIAAEQRDGGVKADLFWLTDPLSMQPYDADGLLAAYAPPDAAALDAADQTGTYWGTRLLNMVIVTGTDVDPAPTDWNDLIDPVYKDAVAISDPGFAGSAFGLLGYFANDPAYGLGFYQRLKDNGAVMVKAPDEVTTGVAEGRFKAGITLDFSARTAAAKGSPVRLVWPTSGAVTLYSPIALVKTSDNVPTAQSFIDFVLSAEGQAIVAKSGWQPARGDVPGGPPVEGKQIRPDWATLFGGQAELLAGYRAIFSE
ncbi:MAG: extracellular solute-binding protein [Candidatus Limnocylindrales bacterium]